MFLWAIIFEFKKGSVAGLILWHGWVSRNQFSRKVEYNFGLMGEVNFDLIDLPIW